MYLIGIDIGGTNLKIGLIEDGALIDRIEVATNSFDLIKQLEATIIQLLDKNNLTIKEISGIGVGCPGVIVNGKVLESANLKLFDCDLQKILINTFDIPVIVKNDADMATLAENKLGAGNGTKNMLMLTIGTGVGGGIIINGNLYEGNGGAGELGHITYVKDGVPCNCGRKGCYEKYVSASALSSRALDMMKIIPNTIPIREDSKVYASDLIVKYHEKDQCAIEVIDQYVEDLSNLVMSLCNNFRPEIMVIGGGISYAPDIISMVSSRSKMYNYGYKGAPEVKIVRAKLGNDAGILGTYAYFKDNRFDDSNLIN